MGTRSIALALGISDVKPGDTIIIHTIGNAGKEKRVIVHSVTKTTIKDGNGTSWSRKSGCIWGGTLAPGAQQIKKVLGQ
jgi:hypothetical protein